MKTEFSEEYSKKRESLHSITSKALEYIPLIIVPSIIIFILGSMFSNFDEGMILIVISVIGLAGIYFLFQLKEDDVIDDKKGVQWATYDWWLVTKAIVPTIIISINNKKSLSFYLTTLENCVII